MKEIGYITLLEAEEISGIKADSFKKRCQDGKIRGAIKQGKTWFVPRDEIVKYPGGATQDVFLEICAKLADLGIGISITLLVKGLVVSGEVISSKEYADMSIDNFAKADMPDDLKNGFKLITDNLFKHMISNAPETIEGAFDGERGYMHLKNVAIHNGSSNYHDPSMNRALRVRLNTIDGFHWGYSKADE